MPEITYSTEVTGIRQFLPAGTVANADPDTQKDNFGIRKEHLIQLWTDVGQRTVAVTSIWLNKPGVAGSQV